MRTLTLKKSGKMLYIVGDAPRVKGDRFQATTILAQERGLTVGSLPGGGNYFACQRGGGINAPVKDYVFDPEKHELDE